MESFTTIQIGSEPLGDLLTAFISTPGTLTCIMVMILIFGIIMVIMGIYGLYLFSKLIDTFRAQEAPEPPTDAQYRILFNGLIAYSKDNVVKTGDNIHFTDMETGDEVTMPNSIAIVIKLKKAETATTDEDDET